jgi:hypothetical protein
MWLFLDDDSALGDVAGVTIPTYNCDLAAIQPGCAQWHIDGYVYMRGCGVERVSPNPLNTIPFIGEQFKMPCYRFSSESFHGQAVHGGRQDLGPPIYEKVAEPDTAAAIKKYFADHPGESSYTFGTTWFTITPGKATEPEVYFNSGDAHLCYGHAGLEIESLDVIVIKDANGLVVESATVSGWLWDVWHFFDTDPAPADMQASYEPDCGRNEGKVFQEKVRVQSEVIDINQYLP